MRHDRFRLLCFVLTAMGLALGTSPCFAAHFATLPPHASLPSGAECAAEISPSPERNPHNVPFNHTVPTPAELAAFHVHPTWEAVPPADFARVDGNFTGSTDMILRWAACKWGIDEDVARAQAWTESKWRQGGPDPAEGGGDKRENANQCIQGAFSGLWNFNCPNCCYQSWGILQTKVYYETTTWPMIKDSTAFNADFRYAETRACMNGDYVTYYNGRAANNGYPTYGATSNPDQLLWGCIGMHYSGDWYDDGAIRYINETKGYYASKPWL